MLALALIVGSIALIDSLNPSTIVPATFIAVGHDAIPKLLLFTAGVFAVSFGGGAVLVLGPGNALLAVLSRPSRELTHALELAGGLGLLAFAVVLWLARGHIHTHLARPRTAGHSSFVLGAAIMAVELPTAAPYFAALVAIVESHKGALVDLGLVAEYNVGFVAPILILVVARAVSGERSAVLAAQIRARLVRYVPVLVPGGLAVLGAVLTALGASGL